MKSKLMKQILKFGIVGEIAFLIDYVSLFFCKEYLVFGVLRSAGIASRVIMGFSPTIFASGNRTAVFMYISIIICMLFILFKDKKINNNISVIFISCLLFITMINYLNCVGFFM